MWQVHEVTNLNYGSFNRGDPNPISKTIQDRCLELVAEMYLIFWMFFNDVAV